MISYSAYYGNPTLSAFASQALINQHAPLLFAETPLNTYASAVESILATTSNILGAEAKAKGMVGGGILSGQPVTVFGGNTFDQLVGLFAVWAAGGVASIVDPESLSDSDWLRETPPHLLLGDSQSPAVRAALGDHQGRPGVLVADIARVPVSKEKLAQRTYTVQSPSDVIRTVRDLGQIELDRPALFIRHAETITATGFGTQVASPGITYTHREIYDVLSNTDPGHSQSSPWSSLYTIEVLTELAKLLRPG